MEERSIRHHAAVSAYQVLLIAAAAVVQEDPRVPADPAATAAQEGPLVRA
jgi:hypothetical protein